MVMVVMLMIGVCQGEEGGKECTESEMQDLQAEYSQCAVQMEYQFEERKDNSEDITDDEVDIVVINVIYNDCFSLEVVY